MPLCNPLSWSQVEVMEGTERNETINMVLCIPLPQGVVIENLSVLVILRMSLSLCKARPHVLPRLPEWGVC